VPKTYVGEKRASSTNGAGRRLYKPDPYLSPCTKITQNDSKTVV
jgi:hypothetical protein